MTPQEFVSHWDISRKELAELCHCHPSTVDRWFYRGKTSQAPTMAHKVILWHTHQQWMERRRAKARAYAIQ